MTSSECNNEMDVIIINDLHPGLKILVVKNMIKKHGLVIIGRDPLHYFSFNSINADNTFCGQR